MNIMIEIMKMRDEIIRKEYDAGLSLEVMSKIHSLSAKRIYQIVHYL